MTKMVFVFGSNEAGLHGAGAAKEAHNKHGARFRMSYGHSGNSFAIPTKDEHLRTLPLLRINQYVYGFLAYAAGHPRLLFQVTRIGCGLAELRDETVAPYFKDATPNCLFDTKWMPYLGDSVDYWGTF